VRQAVLDLDPFTAAAYGCADLDRFHLPDAYETTVATLSVAPPTPATTAAWWAAAGTAAAGIAGLVRAARRRVAPAAGAEGP
jgi:hypothetical protein